PPADVRRDGGTAGCALGGGLLFCQSRPALGHPGKSSITRAASNRRLPRRLISRGPRLAAHGRGVQGAPESLPPARNESRAACPIAPHGLREIERLKRHGLERRAREMVSRSIERQAAD